MKTSNEQTLTLTDLMQESLRIEGIYREPTEVEVAALTAFVKMTRTPSVEDMRSLALTLQPDAYLRELPGMDVRIGRHIPPAGGPQVRRDLRILLDAAPTLSPFDLHCEYEHLHPFMDGNGRTGHALWLWRVGGSAPLGFLHSWYYQALGAYVPLGSTDEAVRYIDRQH